MWGRWPRELNTGSKLGVFLRKRQCHGQSEASTVYSIPKFNQFVSILPQRSRRSSGKLGGATANGNASREIILTLSVHRPISIWPFFTRNPSVFEPLRLFLRRFSCLRDLLKQAWTGSIRSINLDVDSYRLESSVWSHVFIKSHTVGKRSLAEVPFDRWSQAFLPLGEMACGVLFIHTVQTTQRHGVMDLPPSAQTSTCCYKSTRLGTFSIRTRFERREILSGQKK